MINNIVKEVSDGNITRTDYDWVNFFHMTITTTKAYGTALARSTIQYLDATGNVWKVEDDLGNTKD